MTKRCGWVTDDLLYIDYHDNEWGEAVKDDLGLFEFLMLESFQAGLSWITVLRKRENFRQAFDGFDYNKIAAYGEPKIIELLNDSGIIRHRKKIESAINNAQKLIEIQNEFGSFSNYIWGFTSGKPIINHWRNLQEVPSQTLLSNQIAKDLKKRGFKFLGGTTVYAFMQAVGMVNDHTLDCYRHPSNL